MKLAYALPFIFALSANAQNFDDSINWSDVSTTPTVEEQNFIPANANTDNKFIQNQLTDFDFLNQSVDDRVFYNFNAKVRILNKYTDQITDYTVKPTETINLKKFKVLVKSCAEANIQNVENQLAFIEVYKKDEPIFKGWMSNIHKNMNFPELRELYINLISCDKAALESENVEIKDVKQISTTNEIKPVFTN